MHRITGLRHLQQRQRARWVDHGRQLLEDAGHRRQRGFIGHQQHLADTGELRAGWLYQVLRNKIGDFYRSARRGTVPVAPAMVTASAPRTDSRCAGQPGEEHRQTMLNTIEIFPWNRNFETGIAEVDAQHRRLVTLLNTLVSHLTVQADAPTLNAIFDELSDYAVNHFASEEQIWQEAFGDDAWALQHHDSHHQQLRWAIADLQGLPRTIVELL